MFVCKKKKNLLKNAQRLPSTNKKYPLLFFCRICIAFLVISGREGSPLGPLSRCNSYGMLLLSNSPRTKMENLYTYHIQYTYILYCFLLLVFTGFFLGGCYCFFCWFFFLLTNVCFLYISSNAYLVYIFIHESFFLFFLRKSASFH